MKFALLLLFLIAFLFCNTALAQWNSNPSINTAISLAPNWQIDLRIMEDAAGGAFLVWKDYRNGTPDVYAQHIDSNGIVQWQMDGVPVCNQSADQSTPGLISDGAGGIIVSWSDWRSGIERDIYAQRLNAQGQALWIPNGVVVVNKNNREHNQRMVMDGQGGAIVVFEQQNQSTFQWEIWTQRINSSGNTVWNPGGIAVTGFQSLHLNERIQSDGQGGVYVCFQDFRNGFDYDVYVQHIGPNGNYLWGTGVLACNAPGTQTNPKIDPDYSTGGVIVSWTDMRNGVDYDIYAQRINSSGQLQWGATGKPVSVAPGNQSAIDLLANILVQGCIFTWKDDRSGVGNDIYANKLDINGNSVWQTNGMGICTDVSEQLNPNITGDGFGGAVIVWQDASLGDYNIRAQHIYKEGTLHYPIQGMWIGTAANVQTSPKSCSDGLGNGIFAWEDSRSGTPDIFCTRLSWGGSLAQTELLNPQNIHIYPNPIQEQFTIESDEFMHSIEVFDLLGRKYFTIENPGKILNINTVQWPCGSYIVKVKNDFGLQTTQKIIK